ncbi:hypothetical protein CROQUDRAFT_103765 [Cronartium quercuum f. sp. fusiforme G11]|uniref:Exophilin 5 n=1 Tax=Cronartium quercuum f. sp. fusiforme G11 TaxID=708437 RepID=A0A9P6NVP0_9BASI|nr:hypothetical protein CROQUDRAFT_103765 [Cronartium quercuum f. sp. fusiforme G11]
MNYLNIILAITFTEALALPIQEFDPTNFTFEVGKQSNVKNLDSLKTCSNSTNNSSELANSEMNLPISNDDVVVIEMNKPKIQLNNSINSSFETSQRSNLSDLLNPTPILKMIKSDKKLKKGMSEGLSKIEKDQSKNENLPTIEKVTSLDSFNDHEVECHSNSQVVDHSQKIEVINNDNNATILANSIPINKNEIDCKFGKEREKDCIQKNLESKTKPIKKEAKEEEDDDEDKKLSLNCDFGSDGKYCIKKIKNNHDGDINQTNSNHSNLSESHSLHQSFVRPLPI